MGLAGVGDGVASVLGLFGVGVAGMLGLFGAAVAFGLGVGVASPLRLGVDVGVGVVVEALAAARDRLAGDFSPPSLRPVTAGASSSPPHAGLLCAPSLPRTAPARAVAVARPRAAVDLELGLGPEATAARSSLSSAPASPSPDRVVPASPSSVLPAPRRLFSSTGVSSPSVFPPPSQRRGRARSPQTRAPSLCVLTAAAPVGPPPPPVPRPAVLPAAGPARDGSSRRCSRSFPEPLRRGSPEPFHRGRRPRSPTAGAPPLGVLVREQHVPPTRGPQQIRLGTNLISQTS
nr:vegetative cell wall protein gp1-like [Aegilops tauschii subsp. strangulata]